MVVTVAELLPEFGSPTVLETPGVLVIDPEVVPAFTLTTSGKLTDEPEVIVWPVLRVHVKVPVPPTAMVLQVQLAGGVKDTRVVLVGIVSVNVALVSVAGPLLVTDCV